MPIDHMVLMASDIEHSARWYGDLFAALGYKKTRDHVWVAANGIAIDLRPAQDRSTPYKRFGPGLNHIGIVRDDRAAVNAIASAMTEAGHAVPDGQEFPEGYAIFFKDPDGMRVEIGCMESA